MRKPASAARLGAALGGLLAALLVAGLCIAQSPAKRVLVYTRNYTPDGKGYVHENIAASVEAFRRTGAQHGIAVDASDDPNVFTAINLNKYGAIVFSNSNNEAFATDEQRDAFRAYIHQGHGFMAVLDHLAPDLHVLLTTQRDALALGNKAQDAQQFPASLPLAWSHTFDKSREFYIALGHDIKDYQDPLFTGILERGLLWTLRTDH